MSTTSPREQAAANAQASAAGYQQQLTNIAFPELQSILSQVNSTLSGGFGQEPANVKAAFAPIWGQMEGDYDQAKAGTSATISQRAKQSGNMFTTNQITDATTLAGIGLERDRAKSERLLQFQEASAGLDQYNNLLNILGAGSRSALGMGGAGLGLQVGAASGLSGTSQGAGAMGGAASGASMGTMIAPGWGTLIGGVLGGAAGYFGSGG
jgi:hypothetical protein